MEDTNFHNIGVKKIALKNLQYSFFDKYIKKIIKATKYGSKLIHLSPNKLDNYLGPILT